ncbi:MAG: ABC transporter permease [Spirochaetaceae bacterium]|jgi:simple sugar transport system permease protein|nr:ABC transporter permease [Spirochaetaceae bacterium]
MVNTAYKEKIENAGGTAVMILLALGVMVALAFLLSRTPGKTLSYFFLGPIKNAYYFGNLINSAIPLIFGGLGVSVALQGNCFNLGGEGQIYTGAFVATIAAIAFEPLGVPGGIAAIIAGAAVSGSAAAVSALLKARWNTSELITSFLLSNALILIINYFVTGPFLDPATNLQSTRKIPALFRLPQILPPSNLSAALFCAVAAVLLTYIFLYRTLPGYEIRMSGINEGFAKYGGIDTDWNRILPMFLSGGLYGTAGALAVYGTYYATVKEFSAGMGWNGFAVALIARSKPQGVIPAAIFFAWISSGARLAMQFSDVTFEIASIVQSAVFFLVSSAVLRDIFKKKN